MGAGRGVSSHRLPPPGRRVVRVRSGLPGRLVRSVTCSTPCSAGQLSRGAMFRCLVLGARWAPRRSSSALPAQLHADPCFPRLQARTSRPTTLCRPRARSLCCMTNPSISRASTPPRCAAAWLAWCCTYEQPRLCGWRPTPSLPCLSPCSLLKALELVSKPSERAQVRFLPCRNFVRTNAA